MKVLVVGGAGFLGTKLAELLGEKSVEVIIADRHSSHLNVEQVNVTLPADSPPEGLSGVDVIINLAAEHRDDVSPLSKYHDVNVEGAISVCKWADQLNVSRIIFTSSVAVFGFADANTGENGPHNYFNEYGKTKSEAEGIYRQWQERDSAKRTVVIVRPTVIFGPGNRGNVYNLLRQIASRRFVMFGDGRNVKSMAYVENVAAFLAYCLPVKGGMHVFNYIDKPDLSMNQLVQVARKTLFDKSGVGLRMPGFLGVTIGVGFDLLAWLIRRPLPISSIRVKKFMATTQFNSAAPKTGFEAPYTLAEGLEKTLRYEFLEDNRDKPTYETE